MPICEFYFGEVMTEILDGPAPALASVAAKGGGFIGKVKSRPDVEIVMVTTANRDRLTTKPGDRRAVTSTSRFRRPSWSRSAREAVAGRLALFERLCRAEAAQRLGREGSPFAVFNTGPRGGLAGRLAEAPVASRRGPPPTRPAFRMCASSAELLL